MTTKSSKAKSPKATARRRPRLKLYAFQRRQGRPAQSMEITDQHFQAGKYPPVLLLGSLGLRRLKPGSSRANWQRSHAQYAIEQASYLGYPPTRLRKLTVYEGIAKLGPPRDPRHMGVKLAHEERTMRLGEQVTRIWRWSYDVSLEVRRAGSHDFRILATGSTGCLDELLARLAVEVANEAAARCSRAKQVVADSHAIDQLRDALGIARMRLGVDRKP